MCRGLRKAALATTLAVGAAALATAPAASAAPKVKLRAQLQPETLGASTTVSIAFQVAAAGQAPSPLSSFSVRLPAGVGFATSTLGLATCSEQVLLSKGASACPRESLMGFGSALVEAPFGPQTLRETAPGSIFMTNSVDGNTTMLLFFGALRPVIAAIVLQTQLVTPEGSSSSVLDTSVPPIPTAPSTPPVSVLSLVANIGPRHILYYKRVHGRSIAYRPEGLSVPETCPRGGFVFVGEFGFQDASHVTARSVEPCPVRGSR